ncbi:sulfatase [bacterium]|nr:sulfatase [bacterium]
MGIIITQKEQQHDLHRNEAILSSVLSGCAWIPCRYWQVLFLVLVFSLGSCHPIERTVKLIPGTDLQAIVWNQAFDNNQTYLAFRLYDISINTSLPIKQVRPDQTIDYLGLEQGHDYLVLVRLYPRGLVGLETYSLLVDIDGHELGPLPLTGYSYFMTWSLPLHYTGKHPEWSRVTFKLLQGVGFGLDKYERIVRLIGKESAQPGIPLFSDKPLSIDVRIDQPVRLHFQVDPALFDPLISLQLKKSETIFSEDQETDSWKIRNDGTSKLTVVKNRGKPDHIPIKVSFQSSRGNNSILLDREILYQDRWEPISLDLSSLVDHRGQLVFECGQPSRTESSHDFLCTLSDLSVSCVSRTQSKKQDPGTYTSGALVIDREDGGISAPPSIGPTQLNALLISLDTLRADALGCYGNPTIKTPIIDLLSRTGLLYTSVQSQANLTLPSHTSMLYGLPLLQHGIYTNFAVLPTSLIGLDQVFTQAGYSTTMAISAIQLNPWITGLGRQFQKVYHCLVPQKIAEQTLNPVMDWLDYLAGLHSTVPFFCFIHLMDAHATYEPKPCFNRYYYDSNPRTYRGRVLLDSEPFLMTQPFHDLYADWLKDVRDPNYAPALYLGEISYIDQQLELLFRKLVQLGFWSRTVMMLTSDHGESLGEHDIFYDHMGMWQPNFHIPLIIKPVGSEAGMQIETVRHVNIAPTLLRLLDVPIPAAMQGELIAIPHLTAGQDRMNRKEYTVLESSDNTAVAIVHDPWKLIIHQKQTEFFPMVDELFNLDIDPQEKENVLGKNPTIADQLFQFYIEWQQGTGAVHEKRQAQSANITLKESLKALGYIDYGQ